MLVSDGYGAEQFCIRNAPFEDLQALNELCVSCVLEDKTTPGLTLRDEADAQVTKDEDLGIVPGGSCALRLVYSGSDAVRDTSYVALRLHTNDPDHESLVLPVAIAKEPPILEWTDDGGELLDGDVVAEFVISPGKGVEQSLRRQVRIRNGGGGYLLIETVSAEGDYAASLAVGVPSNPLRPSDTAGIELTFSPGKIAAGEITQVTIPLTIRGYGISEQRKHVVVRVKQPPRLTVDLAVSGFKPDFRGHWNQDLTPYGRRDFSCKLTNAGGEPLEIVAIELSHPDVIRFYRGGYEKAGPGSISPPLKLQPRESSFALKLSLDLPRLAFNTRHELKVRLVTEPAEASSTLTLQLRIDRKRFEPIAWADYYIGMDFGTTNSTVAIYDPTCPSEREKYRILRIEEPSGAGEERDLRSLRSVLYFREVDDPIIGADAEAVGIGKADRFLRSFKRTIGLQCSRYIRGRPFSPQDLAEIIFARLLERATEAADFFTSRIVATCPANFANHQRLSTLRACRRALLKLMMHVHADMLQQSVSGAYRECAPGDLGSELLADPEARLLFQTLIHRIRQDQPSFEWEASDPGHCLLLLLYLAIHRSRLLTSRDEAQESVVADTVNGQLLRVATIRRLLEPMALFLDTLEIPFSLQFLAERGGIPSQDLLDFVEDAVAKVLSALKLMDIQLLEEPTAAAYAYVLENLERFEEMEAGKVEHLAVYDLGGGTFDISVVAIRAAVSAAGDRTVEVDVIHSDGINEMGGDDLDFAIIQNLLGKIKTKDPFERLILTSIYQLDDELSRILSDERKLYDWSEWVRASKRFLKTNSEQAKITFSQDRQVTTRTVSSLLHPEIPFEGVQDPVLTRDEFQSLVRSRLEPTVCMFRDVWRKARQKIAHNGDEPLAHARVVLTGKSSQIPLVRQMLRDDPELDLANGERFDDSLRNQEKHCVARGAAYFGRLQSGPAGGGTVKPRGRALPQSVGTLSGGMRQRFRVLCGLEKGAEFRSAGGMLQAEVLTQYLASGNLIIAQYSGSEVDPKDFLRVGVFAWQKVVKDARAGETIGVRVMVDSNGLVSATGMFRDQPMGFYTSTPISLTERPAYVFI